MMKKLTLIIILLLSIVLVTGCGSDSNDKNDITTPALEQNDGDTNSSLSEQGFGDQVISKSIPEGWREDLVPIIDGAVITEGSYAELPTGLTWDVEAYSTRSFDDVYAFYKDVMKDAENLVDYTLEEGAVGGPKGTKNLIGKKVKYHIAMLILPPEDGKVKLSIGLFVANNE